MLGGTAGARIRMPRSITWVSSRRKGMTMTNEEQRQLIDQIRNLLDELEGTPGTKKNLPVSLLNGPYAGVQISLARQPLRISVGSASYTRIDDPDTGEPLDAYVWEKNV